MVISAQNSDAWLSVLQQLMPQGLAWNKEQTSNQTKLLRALAIALAETDSECDEIEMEMVPSNANILLSDYETYLGLPECDSQGETITDRRTAVVTKDKMKGGLATWQIEALAADLGYTITVTETWPHHCLRSCTYPLWPQRYRHILTITVYGIPSVHFTCLDSVLVPLLSGDAQILECMLNKYKMAGKYYDFIYEGDS